MSQSARKAIGSLALLAYVAIYVTVILVLAERVIWSAPGWAALLFYAVAGIVWVAPLKPLFGWMNRPDS